MRSPDASANNFLYSISGSSAGNVWALGTYERGAGAFRTLAERWNGLAWGVVPTPSVGTGDDHLYSIAVISPTDVWAVGESNAHPTSRPRPLIEHWNGRAWRTVRSPSLGQLSTLGNVVAVTPSDVWAAGSYFNAAGNQQTLIEHCNGASWSVVPSPNAGLSYNGLGGVAVVSAMDIWAVGSWSSDQGNTSQTLVEHWDGHAWSIVPTPNLGSGGNGLGSVAARAVSDVWAVGSFFDRSAGVDRTLIEQWNGTSWNIVKSPNPGNQYNQLYAVSAVGGSLWAVGYFENPGVGNTLVEFHC